jgi:hypothetical protein
MSVEFMIGTMMVALACCVLTSLYLAHCTGRGLVSWGAASFVLGPLAPLTLLLLKPKNSAKRSAPPQSVVLHALLMGAGGALFGFVAMHGRLARPEQVLSVRGKRAARETDGPTAFAVASLLNAFVVGGAGGAGMLAGLIVTPWIVLATTRARNPSIEAKS